MAIRQFFILAGDRPYKPLTGKDITYSVELDTSLRHPRNSSTGHATETHTTLTVRITHAEGSWGPNTTRIEGFTRNQRTSRAMSVRGHHKASAIKGERIGLLQVIEDD